MEILKGAEVANALNQTLREALPVFGENPAAFGHYPSGAKAGRHVL